MESRSSRKSNSLARLMSDPLLMGYLLVAAGLILLAVFAPFIVPHDPMRAVADAPNLPVGSPGVILGSDNQGRDILSRILMGARISLIVSIVPTIAATAFALVIGLVSGFIGGRTDSVIMAVMDVFFAFPIVLLAIAVAGALGPGLMTMNISIFIVLIPYIARVARATTLQVAGMPYVEAARSAGGRPIDILLRYILPNMLGPVIVYSATLIGLMIIVAAGLSFLGLGVQPPNSDWGAMVAEGSGVLRIAPHVTFIPGLMIILTALLFNLIGDRLRDIFDPRKVL